MRSYLLIFFFSCHFFSFSQCLTTFQKIIPEENSSIYFNKFAESIDVRNNVAIVGISESDSLQSFAGLAFVYEYENTRWKRTAILSPSLPKPNMKFGSDVKIKSEHIYVSSITYIYGSPPSQGSIFIYKKPTQGWETTHETVELKLPDDIIPMGNKFEVNEQENVIALYTERAMYFYTKNGNTWDESASFSVIPVEWPTEKIEYISLYGDNLAVTLEDRWEFKIKIKKAINSNWTQFADLNTIQRDSEHYSKFGIKTVLTEDHLLVGTASYSTDSVFLYESNDNWTTLDKETVLTTKEPVVNSYSQLDISMEDSVIVIHRENVSGESINSIYYESSTDWQNSDENKIIALPEFTINRRPSKLAYSNQHLLVSIPIADEYNSNNQLIFYSLKNAQEELIDIKTHIEKRTARTQFGRKVAISMDVMATTDEATETVYLYKKDAFGQWQLINKLKEPNVNGHAINLGASLTFYKDYLAIGATSYYESGAPRNTGRVFIYKKKDNWSNVEKVAELWPSNWEEASEEGTGMQLRFGHHVVVDDNVIVVGGPGKNWGESNSQDHGMIYVFEKKANEEWVSTSESAKLRSQGSKSNDHIGGTFDYQDGTIISNHWGGDDNEAYLSVFERPISGWKDTVETQRITISYPSSSHPALALQTGKVIMDGDLVFVGDPFFNADGINYAGRIIVLKKPKYGQWQDSEIVSTIKLKAPENYQMLGFEFDLLDNVLLAGSNMLHGNFTYGLEQKGKVFVFQSLDMEWKNTIELITLDGNKLNSVDGFGTSLAIDKDYFVIGADYDDSATGYQSGAVYSVPMPPLVKLTDPLCEQDGPLNLIAYPSEGIWSGAGIADGKENIFHPELAGPGIHEISYVTPNCHYEGKMRIEVEPIEEISFLNKLNLELCEEDSLILEIDTSKIKGDFRWYFLSDKTGEVSLIEDVMPKTFVAKPGKYWSENYNTLCPAISDTISIKKITTDINIEPVSLICNPEESVKIEVNPKNGIWKTEAINSENILSAYYLEKGLNQFFYEYQASEKCQFSDTLSVTYDPIDIQELYFDSYDICGSEPVVLEVTEFDKTVSFLKKYKDGMVQSKNQIYNGLANLTVEGEYQVELQKHGCSLNSNIFRVEYYTDSIFFPNVVTANNDSKNDYFEVQIENVESISMSILNRYGTTIFKSENYQNNWPDKDYPSGTYFYKCKFNTFCNSKWFEAKGWLQLLR